MTTDSLFTQVRYYTQFDPYFFSVDNRPLQDLAYNDQILANAIDNIINSISGPLAAPNGSSLVGFLQAGTGAVARTAQNKLREKISAADFGVVGDGVTDNQPMLYAMRDYCRTLNKPIEITFEPGTYLYSKNQWIRGINDITLNCEGSFFKCTSLSGFTFDAYPFTGNQGVFNSSGYTTYVAGSTVFGYKFGTINAGNLTVTTTVAADAGNFAVGNKVLIYGYGQQDTSFPPNPRYFEWNEVVSAVAGTGVVTLKNPLKNSYNAAWHDFVQGKGAPRIHNLSRGATDYTFCKRLVVNGGYWMSSTVSPSAKTFQCEGYEQVILNGVKADDFTPSICRTFEVINCDFATCEMDKIISSIIFRGGVLGGLTEGTGVERLELTDNVIIQGTVIIRPRVFVVNGAILDCIGGIGASMGLNVGAAYTMDLVDFRSARWVIKDSTVTSLINGGVETTFLTSSVSSNTKVLVSCASEVAFESLYQSLQEGYTYRLLDGTKQVKITKIYDEDATHAAIEGEWTVAPLSAEIYHGGNIQRIRGLENVTQIGPFAPVKKINFARHEHQAFGDDKGGTLRYTEIDIPRQASGVAATGIDILIRGRVKSIHLMVSKAYTGTDANMVLTIQARTPAVVTYVTANMLLTGPRESNTFAVIGALSLDALTATGNAYVDTIRLFLAKGGGTYPVYVDPVDLPKFFIQIELMKP